MRTLSKVVTFSEIKKIVYIKKCATCLWLLNFLDLRPPIFKPALTTSHPVFKRD